jgi:MFS family permease
MQEPRTAEASHRTSPFQALRLRDYRWYWFSGLGMTGAQNTQRLAMSWLILDLTGSLGQLGLMIFLMGLPMTLTSLWGGVLADRYDRRRILTLSQAFTSANLLILAALTFSGHVQPWQVYASSMGLGVMQALTMPARNALIRSLVGPEDMRNAVALNTIQMQSAQVVWPSVAGGLIALFGVGATLTASASLSIVGIIFLQMVRTSREKSAAPAANPARELVNGLKYCFTTPRIAALTSMGLFAGCFGLCYQHVAPGYSREVLGFNAGETGLFMMSIGIGSILGSMTMLVAQIRDNLRAYFVGAVGLGLSMALMAATPWPVVAMLPNALFGFFIAVMIVNGQTVIQTEVPHDFLGRVTSVWTIAGGIGLATSLPIGFVGEQIGLRYVLIFCGIALACCALANGVLRASVLRERRASTAAAV